MKKISFALKQKNNGRIEKYVGSKYQNEENHFKNLLSYIKVKLYFCIEDNI